MSKVFLEFENEGKHPIVNPSAVGWLYEAETKLPSRVSKRASHALSSKRKTLSDSYERVEGIFQKMVRDCDPVCYFDRPISFSRGALDDMKRECQPEPLQTASDRLTTPGLERRIRPQSPVGLAQQFQQVSRSFRVVSGDQVTLFCEYFPNASEHPILLGLAASGVLKSLVFRHASFARGPFFSERDHARMSDYTEYGVSLHWCNRVFKHMARYVPKERRGFFVPGGLVTAFGDAMVLAIYGSTIDLPKEEAVKISKLMAGLASFYGGNIAFLTGGGGGVMKLMLDTGTRLDVLVGSNFLENADQNLDKNISFYQTFQSGARHMRQRWFEVARFHIFAIGGVGTLEEIGMTLTDIKLGLINREPIVFFGSCKGSKYWQHLVDQLHLISAENRGPKWLETHVLATDDPAEVIAFYQKILHIA
jgi:predicted Rossmann-fold nucleotide-binding protein